MPRVNITVRDYDEAEELDEQEWWDGRGSLRGESRPGDREDRRDSPSRERANARRHEGKRWGKEIARALRQRARLKP
jgi:hypothetical protein